MARVRPVSTRAAPATRRGRVGAPVRGSVAVLTARDAWAASTSAAAAAVAFLEALTAALPTVLAAVEAATVLLDGATVVVVTGATRARAAASAAAAVVVAVTGAARASAAAAVVVVVVVDVSDVAHAGRCTVSWADTTTLGVTFAQRATTTSVADDTPADCVDVALADAPGATLLGLRAIDVPFSVAVSNVMISPAPV